MASRRPRGLVRPLLNAVRSHILAMRLKRLVLYLREAGGPVLIGHACRVFSFVWPDTFTMRKTPCKETDFELHTTVHAVWFTDLYYS